MKEATGGQGAHARFQVVTDLYTVAIGCFRDILYIPDYLHFGYPL